MQQTEEINRYKLEKPAAEQKNLPLTSFRAGAVRATVWENQSADAKFNTISLDRSYKDKNGEWQKSSTLRINDLPKASMVLGKAYEYLILNSGKASAES